jgi:hypothetical protein
MHSFIAERDLWPFFTRKKYEYYACVLLYFYVHVYKYSICIIMYYVYVRMFCVCGISLN